MGAAITRLEILTEEIRKARAYMEELDNEKSRLDLDISAGMRTEGGRADVWPGDALKYAMRAELRADFKPFARRAMRRLFGQLVEARKAAEEELAKIVDEAESAARDAGLGVNRGR